MCQKVRPSRRAFAETLQPKLVGDGVAGDAAVDQDLAHHVEGRNRYGGNMDDDGSDTC